ncbi:MAG: stealth conserved region 3 domain-containing protein [Candidatus Nanopelagicales bacterium]
MVKPRWRAGENPAGTAYRSLPAGAQDALKPAVRLARNMRTRGVRRAVLPTLPLPMGAEITRRERAAVDAVLAALHAAGLKHFLIPRQEPGNIHIGLPAEQRTAFLRQLLISGRDLSVSWKGGPTWRTIEAPRAMESLAARQDVVWVHHLRGATNGPDVRDAARAVAVEFWTDIGDGRHQAVVRNAYASLVNMSAPQVTRQIRTGHYLPTFPAFATPDIADVEFPVDAVYLWVDDADADWRVRRDATMRALGVEPSHESVDAARFRQHDELRYSLRSLSMFAPWVRHVYLVTDQQQPDWLDTGCPRLTVVDHRELMGDAGSLPTYNSHALSARLHHIDGLADHYLYLNDDVFFGRRTGAELWFGGNGLPRFHNTNSLVDPPDLPDALPHVKARNHTLELVEQLTGRTRRRNIQHGPHPMSKSLLMELEERLPEEFAQTWSSQLRGDQDIVIEWLHNQYGYATGKALDGRSVRYRYFNLGDEGIEGSLDGVSLNMPDTLCINDGEGPTPPEDRDRIVRGFLANEYPRPSEFER